MFAVITIAGHQYTVKTGDIVVVDRLTDDVGKTVTFPALLVSDEKKTLIGTPTVEGATVTAKVISHEKGKKIDVRRYKSKVRERRHIGFRAYQSTLEILSVSTK